MNLAYISGKLVNTDNILYINCKQNEETGKIHCLFVLSKEIVIEELYTDKEAFRRAFIRYGLMRKENTIDIILDALKRILKRVKQKIRHRRLKIIK
mgnify:CR=1 FL=1|jgi:hypothetical protein